MVSERIYDLCRSPASVSSELAKDPQKTPGEIFAKLFPKSRESGRRKKSSDRKDVEAVGALKKASECGKWGGNHPSGLFLQIYNDALCSLEEDPMAGITSPSLMGRSGVVPLTIIGPVSDICRHMSNCIVRAEMEIILVTSYWVNSDSATFITNAMRELSVRAGTRGEKVVIKMMYDRANAKSVLRSRQAVSEEEATSSKVKLPAKEEIPNIDLQIVNYHCAWAGTLHSKFMIVDRKIALLESNNIQDTDNLEMMVHVEGPIVDSFYDMALITWNMALDPPLPLLKEPVRAEESLHVSSRSATVSKKIMSDILLEHTPEYPRYDADIVAETKRINASLIPRGIETRRDCVTRHLDIISRRDITGDAPEWSAEDHMTPYILHASHDPCPMALVCREPYGSLCNSSTRTPQNAAFLAAINNATNSIFIQTPNLNAYPLLEPLLNAVRRGVVVTAYLCLGYNDAGQLLPFQNGTNEMTCNRLYKSLTSKEEKARLRMYNYVGKDQTKPINNKFKERSCHIKLMIIDESVAIQGSGNLDTQSFFHSQETNLLIDSPQICREWLEALRRNQNTAQYGAVSSEDGCWHHPETGEMAEGSIGVHPGNFSWAKGIVGAISRVRGVGGF